jgi:MurNAc alpha-1-phosphate uridylyltransferase
MRKSPDAVILFAAGFGTRMGEMTRNRPKPLISVAGLTLLQHALLQVDQAGISRIVVNTHYHAEQIVDALRDRTDVTISAETDTILDTGGGLKKAMPLLGGGAVCTLNTDAVWTGPNIFATLHAAWDPASMDALLLVVPTGRANGHSGGDFDVDDRGRLIRGASHVYTGAQIINSDLVADHPGSVFSLNAIWNSVATAGRLYGVVHSGGWCDVGRPESIPVAEATLKANGDV